MFNQPQSESSGSYFPTKTFLGDLILFHKVLESGTEYDEMAGRERQWRIVEYTNLDTDRKTETAKVIHAGLTSKLPADAEMVLGRIGQARTKNGYTAFVLEPYKPEDASTAKAWLDGGRKAQADPFADDVKKADELNLSAEQIATMRRLGILKADEPGF